ncbi:MAG: DUF934 domain-containing protein [Rhizobiales bacterium]|nr:DUF934 domain-containing protein [Hyphomicrobiales bacterium]
MLIARTGEIANGWHRLDDSAPIPEGGDIIISHRRLNERLQHETAHGRIGLEVANDIDVGDLAGVLARLTLIAVEFPSFADGRGFSIARRLRHLGFNGELRAVGPLIADQLSHAIGSGFDTVEIPTALAERQPAAHWLAALTTVTTAYQGNTRGRRSILEARHGG